MTIKIKSNQAITIDNHTITFNLTHFDPQTIHLDITSSKHPTNFDLHALIHKTFPDLLIITNIGLL